MSRDKHFLNAQAVRAARISALPMWRASVLVGRCLADLTTFFLCALIVGVTGLVVGWRPDAGLGSIAGGFALVLFFAYSLTWIAMCAGLNSKSPESAASAGFIVVFPLAFVSNAMIPTQHMPGWLRVVADWNPESADDRTRHTFPRERARARTGRRWCARRCAMASQPARGLSRTFYTGHGV